MINVLACLECRRLWVRNWY